MPRHLPCSDAGREALKAILKHLRGSEESLHDILEYTRQFQGDRHDQSEGGGSKDRGSSLDFRKQLRNIGSASGESSSGSGGGSSESGGGLPDISFEAESGSSEGLGSILEGAGGLREQVQRSVWEGVQGLQEELSRCATASAAHHPAGGISVCRPAFCDAVEAGCTDEV